VRPPGRRFLARLRPFHPYMLMAPAAIFMLLFGVFPAVRALAIAFQAAGWELSLASFQQTVRGADFALALRNTLLLLAIVVPLETTIALAMAVLAQSRLKAAGFFVYVWSLPLAISDLAAGFVWLSIFTRQGYLSSALQGLHIVTHPVGFVDSDNLASLVVAVALAETWRSVSLVMVIVLSGVQAIPAELGEAAELLGASAWRRFRYVTLPLLKPTLRLALILRTTAAFQVFAVVLVLAGSALPVLATNAESLAHRSRDYRVAAVYAVLLIALSFASTIVYLASLRTRRVVFGR
jgi:multiple sugar transport system permease protein